MLKIILNTLLSLLIFSVCQSQTIEVEKTFGGYKFSQEGQLLKLNQMADIMESNPEALKLINSARINNSASTILGFAGGLVIGSVLTSNRSRSLLIGGGASILAGIIISSSARNKAKKAVDIYNGSLDSNSYLDWNIELNIATNSDGVGLVMNF